MGAAKEGNRFTFLSGPIRLLWQDSESWLPQIHPFSGSRNESVDDAAVRSDTNLAVLIAVAVLVHGTASGENAGCTNNACKAVNLTVWCKNNQIDCRKYQTCLPCAFDGRCDTGGPTQTVCKDQTQLQKHKTLVGTPTTLCDCANAPDNNAAVEASGTYDDFDWQNDSVVQYLCVPQTSVGSP